MESKSHGPPLTKPICIHISGMSMSMAMTMLVAMAMAIMTMMVVLITTLCFIKHLLDMFRYRFFLSLSHRLRQGGDKLVDTFSYLLRIMLLKISKKVFRSSLSNIYN